MLPDQPGQLSLRPAPNSRLVTVVRQPLACRAITGDTSLPLPAMYRACLPLLLLLITPLATGHGQDAAQQAARQALKQGRYVPLERIVRDALQRHPGKLLEVELDDGVYEVEILRADGVVVELDYDARSGALLKTELDD